MPVSVKPPVTKTSPFLSRVAVCRYRPVDMLPVAVHVPVAGVKQLGSAENAWSTTVASTIGTQTAGNQHLAVLKQRSSMQAALGWCHPPGRRLGVRSLAEGRDGSGRCQSDGEHS